MNRNELFRKSLLSTAVVAILHTYSMGAAAAPCPDPVDGGITISSDETCDTITISDDNLANVITVGGTVDGDIINTTGLEFFKVLVGPEGDRDITGSVINRGELILPDGIGTENDYSLFLAGDNLDDDDDSNDLILSIGGDVINEGTATYLEVEYADIGGDLINSGALTHDYLIVRDTAVTGSVVNSGTIGSAETPVFDAIWIDSSAIGGDVRNEGSITGDNIGIHISETDIAGDVENSGTITLTTQGEYYQQVGMFGIQVTNVVPSDGPEGFEILGESTVGGSVINSGTITITDADPESPALIEDMVGGIFVGVELETQETPAAYVTGDVINTGEIHVEVHNHEYGETFGILVENANVTGRVGNVGEDSVITSSREGIIVADKSTVGDVVNEGTITSTGFWDGIYVDESTAASVSNTGLIVTTAGAGINISSSTVSGTVRNDGLIDASGGFAEYLYWDDEGPAQQEYIEGTGIYISADSVCDDGCVDVTSTTDSIINGENGEIIATAFGIDVDSATVNGDIINQGNIYAEALGIYADSTTISGNILNSGLIEGAEGIYLESSENGTTTVNNIINDTTGEVAAEYLGIALNEVEANSVVNNGLIEVDMPQEVVRMKGDNSFGAGIYIRSSEITENITNNGDINVFGTGIALNSWGDGQTTVQYVKNNADATINAGNNGIELNGVSGTGIENLGLIQAGDTGIYVSDSNFTGDIYNNGQINAVYAGIEVAGDYEGSQVGFIVNAENGVITTDSDEEYGDSFGIGAFFLSGEGLGNAGVINSDIGLEAVGSSFTEGVINAGRINAGKGISISAYPDIQPYIADEQADEEPKSLYVEIVANNENGEINADDVGIGLKDIKTNRIVNKGVINITGEPGDIEPRPGNFNDGTGIYVAGGGIESGITNSGEISARNNGIIVDGFEYKEPVNAGFILNDENGVINAGDEGAGIGVGYVSADTLANTGTINGGNGLVSLESSFANDIINEGDINVIHYGVAIAGSFVDGIVGNTGKITAQPESEDGNRTGIIIYDSEINGGVINTGTINAGLDAIYIEESAIKAGLFNENSLEIAIHNTGSLSGSDTGLYIDDATLEFSKNDSIKAALYNEGTIEGMYNGVYFNGELEGNITNIGTISGEEGAAIYAGFGSAHNGSLENHGSIIGGDDGKTVTAIDYGDAFAPLTLVQKAGQIIGSIFGSSEASSDRAYIDGGSITGDLHNIERIYVDGVTTLDGNVYGGDIINIESSGSLTLTGEARSFESDLNLHGGTLSLNISNETDPAEAMLTTEGEIYLGSDSRLVITASQNLEVNLDPVDYLALSGSDLYDDGVTVESGSAIITAELAEVTEDSLSVTVATNDFGQLVESAGGSSNQVVILDAYMQAYQNLPEGQCDSICQAVQQASSAEELAQIADELLPDNSGVIGASQSAQSETLGAVFTRIASFRSSTSGISTGDVIEPGSMWLQAISSNGEQDADPANSIDGYDYRTRGFTIGADADLSDTLTAGLAVTYGVTKSDVKDSPNSSETDSYLLAAYGSWRQQDYFMDSSIAFGISRSDIEQYAVNTQFTADSKAAQLALRTAVGRTFAFDDSDTLVEPQLAFNYSRVDTDSYTLSSEVGEQRIETVELGAGLRAMTSIDTQRGLLIPEVSLMAWHDFASDRGDTSIRFPGMKNFVPITGVEPETTNYQAGFGVQYWLNNNVSLSANYDRSWNSNFSADTWLANIRYDF